MYLDNESPPKCSGLKHCQSSFAIMLPFWGIEQGSRAALNLDSLHCSGRTVARTGNSSNALCSYILKKYDFFFMWKDRKISQESDENNNYDNEPNRLERLQGCKHLQYALHCPRESKAKKWNIKILGFLELSTEIS